MSLRMRDSLAKALWRPLSFVSGVVYVFVSVCKHMYLWKLRVCVCMQAYVCAETTFMRYFEWNVCACVRACVCVCVCVWQYFCVCIYIYIYISFIYIYIYRCANTRTWATHTHTQNHKYRHTEIPTIIDPVALGWFILAVGSIIVGISVRPYTHTYTQHMHKLTCIMLGAGLCSIFQAPGVVKFRDCRFKIKFCTPLWRVSVDGICGDRMYVNVYVCMYVCMLWRVSVDRVCGNRMHVNVYVCMYVCMLWRVSVQRISSDCMHVCVCMCVVKIIPELTIPFVQSPRVPVLGVRIASLPGDLVALLTVVAEVLCVCVPVPLTCDTDGLAPNFFLSDMESLMLTCGCVRVYVYVCICVHFSVFHHACTHGKPTRAIHTDNHTYHTTYKSSKSERDTHR
jgi:hypothetical protein